MMRHRMWVAISIVRIRRDAARPYPRARAHIVCSRTHTTNIARLAPNLATPPPPIRQLAYLKFDAEEPSGRNSGRDGTPPLQPQRSTSAFRTSSNAISAVGNLHRAASGITADAVTLGEAILAQSEPRPVRGAGKAFPARRPSIHQPGRAADYDSAEWEPPVVPKTPLQLSELQVTTRLRYCSLNLCRRTVVARCGATRTVAFIHGTFHSWETQVVVAAQRALRAH